MGLNYLWWMYQILISAKDNTDNKIIKLVQAFEEGLDYYYQQKWDKAKLQFEIAEQMEEHFESRNTTPSKVYIERCSMFKNNPPGENWDGVWTMTAK